MKREHATITDVATAAGVSKTTVSRYINGQTNLLSNPTKARIKKAIALTGYRPNAAASALSRGHGASPCVGIVVRDIAEPGVASLLSRTVDACHARGSEALIVQPNRVAKVKDLAAAPSPFGPHDIIAALLVGFEADGDPVDTVVPTAILPIDADLDQILDRLPPPHPLNPTPSTPGLPTLHITG